jgi:DNA polymerase-3 subunit epsilon
MLSFVKATYCSILKDEHDAFMVRFQRLSKDAQCLLIRMVNQRGAISVLSKRDAVRLIR